jgi:hypothetical protein
VINAEVGRIVGGCVMSDCNSLTNVLEIYGPPQISGRWVRPYRRYDSRLQSG